MLSPIHGLVLAVTLCDGAQRDAEIIAQSIPQTAALHHRAGKSFSLFPLASAIMKEEKFLSCVNEVITNSINRFKGLFH